MPYVRYFKYIVPLQIATGLLSLVIIFIVFIGLKVDGPHLPPPDLNSTNGTITTPPPPTSSNQTTTRTEETIATSSEGNFLTYEQLSISILVVIGCVISLLAPYRLKPNYRFSMVWVMCIAGLVAGVSQLIMIGLRGGCSAAYYKEQQSRCSIQLAVSTMDLMWVVMLLMEGVLNYQRCVDKDFQTRLREQEEVGSERWRWSVTSVVYNPDVELAQRQQRIEEEEEREAYAAEVARGEGGEHGDDEGSDVDRNLEEGETGPTGESSTGRRRRTARRLAIQTPVEVEPLPKYKPKPAIGQPRIHDLGNMPLPPSSPSTPSFPVLPLEPTSFSSLPPSPEGVLPSTSMTITTSTGGTDSGVTAGTGTETGTGIGSGIGSGAEGTIPSSLPPSYSA
ncbi:hypothetical protein KI688_001815 [Linnemannia hyalina]|uniref:Uncharacterized protein n=1 Tax=Linnemannia hyalina TaxID=64524 RepID=A0A9P7XRX1_9FUNG|nr:hypothetical protein KI688_001815 [Linnemannia hyalina]